MMLYKAIKKNNIKARYYGIDCDINFINIGLRKFPELKKNIKQAYFEKIQKINSQELIISSATLEHVNNYKKFLKNLIKFSKKYILIRTYVGDINSFQKYYNFKSKKYINRNVFSLFFLTDFFLKKNYKVEIIKDWANKKKKFKTNKQNKLFDRVLIIFLTKI